LQALATRFLVGVAFTFASFWALFLDIPYPAFQLVGFSLNLVGSILMVSAYGREPKLLFVLPFKALRLTVLDTRSGIALFSYTWNEGKDLIDDQLFSGMLDALNKATQETIKRGKLQEIRVTDALIMIQYDTRYPVATFLVTTRPSQSLRDGLQMFAQKFSETFLTPTYNSSDMSQFSGALDLIGAIFPQVPVYN